MTIIALQSYPCKVRPMHIAPKRYPADLTTKTIVIPFQNGLEALDLDQILMLKADSNYTYIYLINGQERLVAKTLKCFEVKLKNSFLRVHNSYLINPKHIRFFCFKENLLRLKNNIEVPVSRSKKATLIEFLKRTSV